MSEHDEFPPDPPTTHMWGLAGPQGMPERSTERDACTDCRPTPQPTWQCEFCGRFYSERTAKDHAYCVQAEDRRNAEQAGVFGV